jgi:hypothetical protein
MRSLRSDPYLWVHLAGVAAVPIFLELCLLGLGMGSSLMPIWFELLFVGGLGIAPILWMQWQRPFCIFSLLLLALRPDQLSEDQRRILGLFKSPVNQFLSVGVAVLMAGILWRLYEVAPLAHDLIFPSATRGTGLLIAAIAFFFANLFLQVPASVLRVLLVGESIFAATEPYPVEQIPNAFTLIGVKVKKILPALIPKPSKPVVIRPPEVSGPKEVQKIAEETQQEIAEIGEAIASETPPEIQPETPPEIQTIDGAIAEEPIAAVAEAPETPLENPVFEEAIAHQEPEAVVESEIVELEVVELEVTALDNENFLDADEIIEVVERVEVIETASEEETVSEEERAIAPEPTEEDWEDDDLDNL